MKIPNGVWTIILVTVPAVSMLISDLAGQGLLPGAVASALLALIPIAMKYREESLKEVEEVTSRDIFDEAGSHSALYRTFFS